MSGTGGQRAAGVQKMLPGKKMLPGSGQMPRLQAPAADRKAEARMKILERNLVLRTHLSPEQLPRAVQEDSSGHHHRNKECDQPAALVPARWKPLIPSSETPTSQLKYLWESLNYKNRFQMAAGVGGEINKSAHAFCLTTGMSGSWWTRADMLVPLEMTNDAAGNFS